MGKGSAGALNRLKQENKMKQAIVTAAIAALVAGVASAADVSLTADFASAYVFRGVTLNDGMVFQPGAEISGFPIPEEYGSVSFGTWANLDLESPAPGVESGEFSEIDYYVSYSAPIESFDLGLGYVVYTYPNGGESDREVSISIGDALGDSGIYAGLSVNYGVDGAIDEDTYILASLDYETEFSEALSGSAGVTAAYFIDDDGKDGFADGTALLGLSYALNKNWSLSGSLTYIAQLDDEVLTDAAYDVDIVGRVGLACDF
jgi:uncharacterized protein (TIGR02001 family)